MNQILIAVPVSIIVFALGASIGSFINVVVYRVPAGLSLLFPPSRCPHCLNRLKAYDNVPVLGWICLGGRCRYCRSQIAIRYPVVETVTGLIFIIIFCTFKFSFLTIGYWVFSSWLLALSLIDLDTMTLPDPLTKSGLVLGVIFHFATGWLSTGNPTETINKIIFSIAGAILGLWLFDVIANIGSVVLGKTAMGAGDAKLAAMMGAWLGCKYLLLACFLGCCSGVIINGSAIFFSLRKRGESKAFPFGPHLAIGSVITLFAGEVLVSSYLKLFFNGG